MSKSGSRGIPWRRATAEGAAILVSILLAFAIDAWWEQRQERKELGESLTALRVAFLENRARLDSALAQDDRRLRGLDAALRLTPDEIRALPADSIEYLSKQVSIVDLFSPTDAALQALLSANLLETINDPELRTAITGWPGRVEESRQQFALVLNVLTWFGRRNAELGLFTLDPECWAEYEETPATDFESCGLARTFLVRLTDPEFRGILGQQHNLMDQYVILLRDLEEPLDHTLSLLPAEP